MAGLSRARLQEGEDRPMSLWQAYLDDILFSFRKQKEMTEQAISQLDDGEFFARFAEHSNSVAAIVKHLGGNLKSRWTDLLTTDGDKPWRDRDAEFVITPEDTRAVLLAAWEEGWAALFGALVGLGEGDLFEAGHDPRGGAHGAAGHRPGPDKVSRRRACSPPTRLVRSARG